MKFGINRVGNMINDGFKRVDDRLDRWVLVLVGAVSSLLKKAIYRVTDDYLIAMLVWKHKSVKI